jgi:hypothetical protein
MLKDFPSGGRLLNEGDDLHLTSAWTGQGIDLIDFLEQPSPVSASLLGIVFGRGVLIGGFDGARHQCQ